MIELWGGIECTVNRVRDRWFDQIARSGHQARLEDLDRIAALGIRTLRYPILWERAATGTRGVFDWSWTDVRMERLRALGIRPIVGLLHHGSGPATTSLVDPDFPAELARFARAVAQRYPWVTDYTPVNEPLTTARFSGLYGHWYPHGQDDVTFVRALLQQIRAVAGAMRAIRSITPQARLIQTEDCGVTLGTPATARQVTFEGHRRWLTFDLLTGRVDSDHPLWHRLTAAGATRRELETIAAAPCPPDVIGLNYYLTSDRFLDDRVGRYPADCAGGNGEIIYADVEAVRVRPEGIIGHETHLLEAWARYRIPVAITEAHLGCTRDEQLRWLHEAWQGAQAAQARGADVRAVTAWALLGTYDWNSLVTQDAGHYEPGAFDVRSSPPRPTALAGAIAELARDRGISSPALTGTPWWRRSERLLYAPSAPRQRVSASGPPLLILGATGTLGRAFSRVCDRRGLRARLLGRSELEITDPTGVDAVIRHLKPWAVINATGYVRVDDAERDRDACWRANVIGPVTLAAACRRRGVPLVTFSTDLVFDGAAGRAYTEGDTPNPLNVYGESKLEAEHRVLDLLDDALVVRTSAFFGPWDSFNFVACVLRAIDSAETFLAAGDSVVSPTYVPHLADATLDLLIDGERGIWHLANEGAASWFEFARAAALECGRSTDSIAAAPIAQLCQPAKRPAFSALTSRRGALMPSLQEGLAAFARAAREGAMAPGRETFGA